MSYVNGRNNETKKVKEEENVVLVGRKSKGKSQKGFRQTSKGNWKKHKDMSKFKCFRCHQPSHFAIQCLLKNNN